MRLDGVDVRSGQSGVRQCGADDALLRRAVRGGQAVGRAVGVDRAAAQHGERCVAVAASVGQPLQQEQAGAFGPAGAARGLGERPAAAVRGEAALVAELDERAGRRHHRDPAGDGERALARGQRAGGHVQRDQRRRARGVDGDRRAFQAEQVGDPAGQDARGGAGEQVPGQLRRRRVAAAGASDVDAGGAAAQAFRVDAGAFEQLPRHFEELPLLRVHRESFARGDAEEAGVEVGDAVDEAALVDVGRAAAEAEQVPATVLGELGDRVGAVGDQPPQVLGRADATRVPAAHADDDDRVAVENADATGATAWIAAAEQFGREQTGDGVRARVVEDQRGR